MRMQVFLLVTVVLCLLLHFTNGTKVAKRQTSCQTATAGVPRECEPILTDTISNVAFSDPAFFIDTYCGETCAEPLYNYFLECDAGSSNATEFDFLCSSNTAGDYCLYLLHASDYSIFSICQYPAVENGRGCTDRCASALEAEYSSMGCCLPSVYAVYGSEDYANYLFDLCLENQMTFCVGGVSGGGDRPGNESACEELLYDVDVSCRHLETSVQDVGQLGELCGSRCGPDIYRFSLDCDEVTGEDNAIALDVICAVNGDDERCGDLVAQVYRNVLYSCEGVYNSTACSAQCRNALIRGMSNFSCCLPSLIQVLLGEEYVTTIFPEACNVEMAERCVGRFSGGQSTVRPTTATETTTSNRPTTTGQSTVRPTTATETTTSNRPTTTGQSTVRPTTATETTTSNRPTTTGQSTVRPTTATETTTSNRPTTTGQSTVRPTTATETTTSNRPTTTSQTGEKGAALSNVFSSTVLLTLFGAQLLQL